MPIHSEGQFEKEIVAHLVENGYQKRKSSDFDKDYCFDNEIVLQFLQTQEKAWKALTKVYGADVEKRVLLTLKKELELNGTLHVIRKGFTDMGVKLYMSYEKSEHSLNDMATTNYQKNIFSVIHQVYYSRKDNNSVDIVLFFNGLPVATAELKNQFTGQNYRDAIHQYQTDRSPKELLFSFKKRALVHFAVDTDEVYITTKLDGDSTRFLPFNKGNNGGAGNPLNENGHRTAYLWEEVWQKDVWYEILRRFILLEKKKYTDKSTQKITRKESIIFPRYHQLDAIRSVLFDIREDGIGNNYLIRHSAGSGKSYTIAWLAYRLSAIHNPDNQKTFDSVVVITDRRVLDKQLQDTIFNIEHTDGVVEKIDKDSRQLATALKRGKHIIITTIQKFPYILEQAKDFPDRKYAVIIDEAHSSQSGDAHAQMKKVLSKKGLEFDANDVDGLEFVTDYEIKEQNLSFFAFTATPKAKTIAIFGTKGTDGKPRAFHTYSMRQAIEEGFILDVLKNYTIYETYWKLIKKIHDDPEMHKKKTRSALGKYIALNPHNISQKTDIILDHFEKIARHKIGRKAKAMLITGSRLHAVRYFEEFKRQIKEKNYDEIRALVAFSREVTDKENGLEQVTEVKLNGFPEKQLPKKFEQEYNILLVADKYQTGFDEPLLQTMYVDKPLSGVKAVQTLSRLNRMHAGKDETFVLDFVNDYETIRESFQDHYEATTLTENPDPNLLYQYKQRIYESQIIWQTEVEAFAKVFFKHSGKLSKTIHAKLHKFIDPAVERFQGIQSEEEQHDLKNTLNAYLSMFTFLSQLMPFQDVELEILYPYVKFLMSKIKGGRDKTAVDIEDKVALQYYRLKKVAEGDIILEIQGESAIPPPTEVGLSRDKKEEKEQLSKIIDLLNNQFDTDFTDADALTFDQWQMDLQSNDNLRKQAENNNYDNFFLGFEEIFLEVMLERMDINREIFDKIMENESGFGDKVKEYISKRVYNDLRKNVAQQNT